MLKWMCLGKLYAHANYKMLNKRRMMHKDVMSKQMMQAVAAQHLWRDTGVWKQFTCTCQLLRMNTSLPLATAAAVYQCRKCQKGTITLLYDSWSQTVNGEICMTTPRRGILLIALVLQGKIFNWNWKWSKAYRGSKAAASITFTDKLMPAQKYKPSKSIQIPVNPYYTEVTLFKLSLLSKCHAVAPQMYAF